MLGNVTRSRRAKKCVIWEVMSKTPQRKQACLVANEIGVLGKEHW